MLQDRVVYACGSFDMLPGEHSFKNILVLTTKGMCVLNLQHPLVVDSHGSGLVGRVYPKKLEHNVPQAPNSGETERSIFQDPKVTQCKTGKDPRHLDDHRFHVGHAEFLKEVDHALA